MQHGTYRLQTLIRLWQSPFQIMLFHPRPPTLGSICELFGEKTCFCSRPALFCYQLRQKNVCQPIMQWTLLLHDAASAMGLSFLLKGNQSCCYLFEIQFLKLGKPFGIWLSLFIEFKGNWCYVCCKRFKGHFTYDSNVGAQLDTTWTLLTIECESNILLQSLQKENSGRSITKKG